jgi:hypothetical protein
MLGSTSVAAAKRCASPINKPFRRKSGADLATPQDSKKLSIKSKFNLPKTNFFNIKSNSKFIIIK